MTQLLKVSTAYTFRMGPFVDSADGNTDKTALTIGSSDVKLSKAGAAFAAKNDATAPAHDTGAPGHYSCVLNTTDTGTLGTLRVACHVTGALYVWHDFLVVPANVYDALVANSDKLEIDAVQWLGGAIATPTVTGVPETDVTHFNGTAGTFAAGRPEVNATHVAGTAQTPGDVIADTNDIQARLPAALIGGRMDATVGAYQTGQSPADSVLATPANKLATDASGRVTEVSIDGIPKNAALNNFEFLMVDATDGYTAKTGLTVTAQRSIAGGAFASCANAVAEVGLGVYKIDLAATDLNGDVITLRFSATGARDRFITLKTNQ